MDMPAQLQNGHPAASANNHQPSASSAGPQIRSRITVVCAECKRLKLKCDRRAPCGSCTKRDTVVRCIYSPAAAEKVDLHSLNNRLIQVEAILAMITAGQNPPTFQSSYPFSYPTGSSQPQQPLFSSPLVSNASGSHPHQHHHHYAVPSSHTSPHDSLSLSASDLASIWLDHLDLGVPSPSSACAPSSSSTQRQRSFSNPENVGLIKLEPSPIDMELSHPQPNALADTEAGRSTIPSRVPSPVKRNSFTRSEHHHQQQQQRSSAQLLLPALSIYYPMPSIPPPGTSASSSAPFPHHPQNASPSLTPLSTSPTSNSANAGNSSSSHLQPQYAKPQVTPALLALLPSLPACKRLLQNARDIFRVRPIPFESGPDQGWRQFETRCLTLLGGGANKEKEKEREKKEREKEKAREARRARQIYFGGIPGLQPHVAHDTEMDDIVGSSKNATKSNAESTDDASDDQSLTFFALMCSALAVGASIPSSPASSSTTTDAIKESPAFLYALSQQALGVWDTHASSMSSGNALTAAEETEKLGYLLACIAGLCYLLFSSSPTRVAGVGETEREAGVSGLIYLLVGKLVNAARSMGLARDSSVLSSVLSRKSKDVTCASERHDVSVAHGPLSGNGVLGRGASKREREAERERIREEWKKMIWWEVLFYDLFTADSLGHQSYIPAHLFSVKLPDCSSAVEPAHSDDQDSDDDYSDFGHGVDAQHEDFRPKPKSSQNTTSPVAGDVSEREQEYLGARYRLTQLSQSIKNRLAHPECCCGYTLDQAAQLEAEVRRWQTTLPVALRWSEPPDNTAPLYHKSHSSNTDKVVHLQSCELAVVGNLLLVNVYTPFLRHASSGAPTDVPSGLTLSGLDGNSTPALEAAPISASAAQTTLHAAQMIIRAVKDAYATQAAITIFSSSTTSSSSPSASPGKTPAWPAAVSPAMFDLYPIDKVVYHAAVICAHAGLASKAPAPVSMDVDALLDDATVALGALLTEQGAPSVGPLGTAQRKVADVLYKRVVTRANAASHGMKRKHSQINLTNPFGVMLFPHPAPSNTISISAPEHDWTRATNSGPSGQHQYQQNASIVALETPVQSSGPPPNLPQNRIVRTEHQKQDLASAVRLAVSARAAERGGDEKETKYAKKASYPSVGVRIRPAKDTPTRSRQHSLSTAQPLMTSTPRPLPTADAVIAYQQQQKNKLQQVTEGPSAGYDGDPNRSRSSSFSRVQAHPPQQQQPPQHSDSSAEDMQYPYFGGSASSDMLNMQMMPRKRFSIHEEVPTQQQPLSPERPPFTPNIFDQTHPQAMFDHPTSFDGSSGPAVEGMGYSTVSSPFSNGAPTSSSGSPFTGASVVSSGHPPTPAFTPHHPTAPVFGPQPPDTLPTSSPTSYFHTPTAFSDTAYSGPSTSSAHLSHQGHGSHSIALGLNVDQNLINLPGEPVYEKAAQHQATMYEMKSGMEHHQMVHQQRQTQHQAMGASYEEHGMPSQGQQLGMGMTAAVPWTPTEQQQQHQQHAQPSNQPFWNNGAEYRFYP